MLIRRLAAAVVAIAIASATTGCYVHSGARWHHHHYYERL